MGKKSIVIMPDSEEILRIMGEQIKEARLRREISADLVAERASLSRATVWAVEKGSPSVAIGAYVAVLHAINGMDKDLLSVARDETLEKTFLAIGRTNKARAPKKDFKRGDIICKKK